MTDIERDTIAQEQLDDDVARLAVLDDHLAKIAEERQVILARLQQYPHGRYEATSGITVTVSGPNRKFNLDRAVGFLSMEQRALCKADAYDPKKVKAQLPPVLLDQAMDAGDGPNRVKIA